MMLELIIPFLIAVLMGMGIGGGGFLVIYLTLCLNYPQILAQGTNLAFFVLCNVFAVLVHIIKRRIDLKLVIMMSAFGSLGAWALSGLANIVDPDIPKIMLGWLLAVSGIIGLYKSLKNKK